MKKTLLGTALLCALSPAAFCQSSVTVFGIFDTAVRYTTNANVAGNGNTVMANGIFQGSRLGFMGKEDLGGGTAATFDLISGFGPTTGVDGQQGQLFGLNAFVGLKDQTLGEVDAGRQMGLAFQTLGNYDPLANGVSNETSWQIGLEGNRFDNTIEYTNSFGPFKAQAQYSFGGQAEGIGIGATKAADLSYVAGPLNVGAVYQQSQDLHGNDASLWGLGAYYIAGPAKLMLNYFDAKRDPGFAKAANLSGGPLANTSLSPNAGNALERTDDVVTAAVLFNANPATTFTLAYMHDAVKDEASTGVGGSITTVYGVAEYFFSKRTEVYAELDHTTLGGDEIADPNSPITTFSGHSGRTGFSLGMRTNF